jgi:hypothetical protein
MCRFEMFFSKPKHTFQSHTTPPPTMRIRSSPADGQAKKSCSTEATEKPILCRLMVSISTPCSFSSHLGYLFKGRPGCVFLCRVASCLGYGLLIEGHPSCFFLCSVASQRFACISPHTPYTPLILLPAGWP